MPTWNLTSLPAGDVLSAPSSLLSSTKQALGVA